MFYRAGATHENRVGKHGYEQLQIEFDPGWLRSVNTTRLGPTRHWIGGGVAAAARSLSSTWSSPDPAEATIAKAYRTPLPITPLRDL